MDIYYWNVFLRVLEASSTVGGGDCKYVYVLGCFAQPGAFAIGARGSSAVTAEHDPKLYFVTLFLEVCEKGMQPFESWATIPNPFPFFIGQFIPRLVDRKVHFMGTKAKPFFPKPCSLNSPACNGIFIDGESWVGHDAGRVDSDDVPESLARLTSPDRAVEGE